MFTNYSENSRVWVYQSSKTFTPEECIAIQQKINAFTGDWSAHKLQLKAAGQLIYNQFIVLIVDENQHEASGCSIDSSVKFIQQIEKEYAVSLMDRMQIAYKKDANSIAICSLHDLGKLAEENKINSKTIVFNNLVANKKEFDTNWEIAIENSWHKNFIPQIV